MTRLLWIIAICTSLTMAGVSCKKKDDDKKTEKSAKAPAKPTKPNAKKNVPQPPKKPAVNIANGDDLAKRMQECTGYSNAKDMAKLLSCYTNDGEVVYVDFLPPMTTKGRKAIEGGTKTYWSAFSEAGTELAMLLVKDKTEVVTVSLSYGTNTGDYHSMKATNKKFGALGGSRAMVNAVGEITREYNYLDQGAWAGQLMGVEMPHRPARAKTGTPVIVAVSKGDDKEAKNLSSIDVVFEQMNAHDADKVMDQYTEEIKFLHQGAPEDVLGKDNTQDQLEAWFKMTTDVQVEAEWKWAAGDYVVVGVRSRGTNNGALPDGSPATNKKFDVHELHVYHLIDGKVDTEWVFGNSMTIAVQLGFAADPSEMKGDGGKGASEAAPPIKKGAPAKKAG